jgi:hypothetical protein
VRLELVLEEAEAAGESVAFSWERCKQNVLVLHHRGVCTMSAARVVRNRSPARQVPLVVVRVAV